MSTQLWEKSFWLEKKTQKVPFSECRFFVYLKFSFSQKDVWCDCADEEPGMVYLNLLLNPERYTGYVGLEILFCFFFFK